MIKLLKAKRDGNIYVDVREVPDGICLVLVNSSGVKLAAPNILTLTHGGEVEISPNINGTELIKRNTINFGIEVKFI